MNNKTIILIVVLLAIALAFFALNRGTEPTPAEPIDVPESTEPAPPEVVPVDNADPESVIGMTEAEAAAYAGSLGVMFRVVEADGQPQPMTRDFREDRINATTKNGIVVDFYIEGEKESDAQPEAGAHDSIIGMTEAEAQAYAETNNVLFRVGSIDGEPNMLTMDFIPGRITADVEDGLVTTYTTE